MVILVVRSNWSKVWHHWPAHSQHLEISGSQELRGVKITGNWPCGEMKGKRKCDAGVKWESCKIDLSTLQGRRLALTGSRENSHRNQWKACAELQNSTVHEKLVTHSLDFWNNKQGRFDGIMVKLKYQWCWLLPLSSWLSQYCLKWVVSRTESGVL